MFMSPETGVNPNNFGSGMPQDIPMLPVGPETRDYLFEHMQQEVDAGNVPQATASWLLHLAFENPTEAMNLRLRFTRRGGFNGSGSTIGGGYVS